MSLDHVAIYVPDDCLQPLADFLVSSLSHLSFQKHPVPIDFLVALGLQDRPYFWLSKANCEEKGWKESEVREGLKRQHYGFVAESKEIITFREGSTVLSL